MYMQKVKLSYKNIDIFVIFLKSHFWANRVYADYHP